MTVIRWFGHACFLITTLMGTRILINPPHFLQNTPVRAHSIPANLVFLNENTPDQDNGAAAASIDNHKPTVLQPLFSKDSNVEQNGTYTFGPVGAPVDKVRFRRILGYSTSAGTNLQGEYTISVMDTSGLRITDIGRLGDTTLDPTQVKQIGRTDVLILPVTMSHTGEGVEAAALVNQLKPRVVLMPEAGSGRSSDDSFLTALAGSANVVRSSTRAIRLSAATLPRTETVYILR